MSIDLPVVIEASADAPYATIASLGDAKKALAAWASHEGVNPIDLPASRPPLLLPLDAEHDARTLRIESVLRETRDAIDRDGAGSASAVRDEIARELEETRAHPEAPEAASFVAELLRTLARVEALSGDLDGAAALRARADRLSPRLLGLSEREGVPKPSGATFDAIAGTVTFAPLGDRRGTLLEIDGVSVAWGGPYPLADGEHRLRVLFDDPRDNAGQGVLAAQWFSMGASAITIAVPFDTGLVACSREDLNARLAGEAIDPTFSAKTSCTRWARVKKRAGQVVEVRACDAERCGPPTTYAAPIDVVPPHGGGDETTSSIWSSGWTWTAIGAAAIAVGSLAAWRLGAFDRPSAPPPTWQWQGVK